MNEIHCNQASIVCVWERTSKARCHCRTVVSNGIYWFKRMSFFGYEIPVCIEMSWGKMRLALRFYSRWAKSLEWHLSTEHTSCYATDKSTQTEFVQLLGVADKFVVGRKMKCHWFWAWLMDSNRIKLMFRCQVRSIFRIEKMNSNFGHFGCKSAFSNLKYHVSFIRAPIRWLPSQVHIVLLCDRIVHCFRCGLAYPTSLV